MVFDINAVLNGAIPLGDDRCRFDYNILEREIKTLIQKKLGDENAAMDMERASPEVDPCLTFVVATRGLVADGPLRLFRSYQCESEKVDSCGIWEAARATTADPSFFKHVCITDPSTNTKEDFIGGGIAYNNPSELALQEARKIWTDSKQFSLLSIGTGYQNPIQFIQINDSIIPYSELKVHPDDSNPTVFSDVIGDFHIPQMSKQISRAPAGVDALSQICS